RPTRRKHVALSCQKQVRLFGRVWYGSRRSPGAASTGHGNTGGMARERALGVPGARADAPHQIPWRGWVQIVRRVAARVVADRFAALSAGVAFFAVLSIAPVLLAALSVYGAVNSPEQARDHLAGVVGVLPPPSARCCATSWSPSPRPRRSCSPRAGCSRSPSPWAPRRPPRRSSSTPSPSPTGRRRRARCCTGRAGAGLRPRRGGGRRHGDRRDRTGLPSPGGCPGLAADARPGRGVGGARRAHGAGARGALPVRPGPARPRQVAVGERRCRRDHAAVARRLRRAVRLRPAAGTYERMYGSLAGVAISMLWLWLTVLLVVLGAAVNAEAERQTTRDSTVGAERPPGERGAVVADDVPPHPAGPPPG